MNLNSIMKMRELELESDEESQAQSNSDHDTCAKEEIEELFGNCCSIAEESVGHKKYILQVAGTLESSPNVALSLSNHTCEVYNLSNNQFAKLTVLDEHTDVISEVKFSRENSNLLYTGSNDGLVKLWDLRTPKSSIIQFKDTTVENNEVKQITCFDISPNNLLLAAGTNLFEGDAFVLFWDVRNRSLMGGYWESHTDDITQVKFHTDDSNKLLSGSVDGLINLYDLSQSSEEDALIDSLNTDSSVEKLSWLHQSGKEVISCITHTADVQFWTVDDAQPYFHLHRSQLASEIRRESDEYIYVVDVHETGNSALLLAGCNDEPEKCFRGLSVSGNTVTPALGFSQNKQLVRASWFNPHMNLLLTGGEKGILNAWEIKVQETTKKK